MSVATKNPFAILSEESFPEAAPKTAAKTATPAAAPAKDNQKKGPSTRGGRYYQRGGGTKPANRDPVPEGGAGGDALYGGPKKYDGQIRGRGRGRGRGDPMGGRGGRGERRAFDRHSQTAKTDSEKKLHQGWGGDDGEQERKDEVAAGNDAAKEAAWGGENTDADAWGSAPTGEGQVAEGGAEGGGEGRRREREPEEEDNTLTLDEYIAQQKEKENLPKIEATRKANEGDDSVFSGAKQLKKGDEDEESYFAGKGKAAPKARAEKKEKVFLEFDARFERPQRGGRGRGGDRGGDRGIPRAGGPRGRGGPYRGGRNNAAVDVDDERAFPSLA